jgi:hypothetical protein
MRELPLRLEEIEAAAIVAAREGGDADADLASQITEQDIEKFNCFFAIAADLENLKQELDKGGYFNLAADQKRKLEEWRQKRRDPTILVPLRAYPRSPDHPPGGR